MSHTTDKTIKRVQNWLVKETNISKIARAEGVAWETVRKVRDGELRLSSAPGLAYCDVCGAWVSSPCPACTARANRAPCPPPADAGPVVLGVDLHGDQLRRYRVIRARKERQEERYPNGCPTKYVRHVYRVTAIEPRHHGYLGETENTSIDAG